MIFPSVRARHQSLKGQLSLLSALYSFYILTEMNGSIKAVAITDEAADQAWNMKNKLILNRLIIMRITQKPSLSLGLSREYHPSQMDGNGVDGGRSSRDSLYPSQKLLPVHLSSLTGQHGWASSSSSIIFSCCCCWYQCQEKTTKRMYTLYVTIGQLHISSCWPQVPVRLVLHFWSASQVMASCFRSAINFD